MRTPLLFVALTAVLALPGTAALADPMQDICHARAQKDSGYQSRGPKVDTRLGGAQMRLSGSVALGGSRSRGGQSAPGAAPPFAGSAATERRERDAQAKYQRIYDACMRQR